VFIITDVVSHFATRFGCGAKTLSFVSRFSAMCSTEVWHAFQITFMDLRRMANDEGKDKVGRQPTTAATSLPVGWPVVA